MTPHAAWQPVEQALLAGQPVGVAPDYVGAALPPAVWVDLSACQQVVSYPEAEFLITAETGMTVQALSDVLKAARQQLPVVANPARSLLSLLAHDPLTVSRGQTGSVHRWVTGTKTLTGDGQWVHYGGEIVKNVTGYDLNKLFVGSGHQFGLIAQATLKTQPLQRPLATHVLHVSSLAAALALVQNLQQSASTGLRALALFQLKTSFGVQVFLQWVDGPQTWVSAGHIPDVFGGLVPETQRYYLPTDEAAACLARLDWTDGHAQDELVLQVHLHDNLLQAWLAAFLSEPDPALEWFYSPGGHACQLRWAASHVPHPSQIVSLSEAIQAQGGLLWVRQLPIAYDLPWQQLNANPQPLVNQWQAALRAQYDPQGCLTLTPERTRTDG